MERGSRFTTPLRNPRGFELFDASSLPCDTGFDFFGSERAKSSRKKHQELAAALESRKGFEFFCTSPLPSDAGFDFSARSARRLLHPKADLEAP